MTTQVVFEKVAQGPGPIGPSPSFLIAAGGSAVARVVANTGTGANQFDNVDGSGNPTLLFDVRIERSDDGGDTWILESFSQVVGGSREHGGPKLPGQTVNNTESGDRLYRVTYTTNKNLPIGCNWETP